MSSKSGKFFSLRQKRKKDYDVICSSQEQGDALSSKPAPNESLIALFSYGIWVSKNDPHALLDEGR